jgi:hypothetical protein
MEHSLARITSILLARIVAPANFMGVFMKMGVSMNTLMAVKDIAVPLTPILGNMIALSVYTAMLIPVPGHQRTDEDLNKLLPSTSTAHGEPGDRCVC